MATYLSPGVFPREIDLSLVPSSIGPLRPAFIGTANKGPLNTPIFCSNAQIAVDNFGEPFPESYLMYAALAYFEQGNQCYIVRIGVEEKEGQDSVLDDIAIDTSGNRISGWGRIPLFTGIDYGRISLREPTADEPYVFHDNSVDNIDYNDQSLSTTDGATTGTLNFTGTTDTSDEYTGCLDESWIVLITGDPDDGEAITGATYEVIRNSDNVVVDSGTLTDDGTGESQVLDIGQGLAFTISVTAGRLEENDTFSFTAAPDNRSFSVSVEGGTATTYTFAAATYTTIAAFVAAANLLIGAGEDYIFVEYTDDDGNTVPQLRTRNAGRRIQLMTTCAWAAECGTAQYAWDIPRSYLIGADAGPYAITTQNNRVILDVIPDDGTTETAEFSITNGLNLGADDIATNIDLAGVIRGDTYFISFALTVPGGSTHVVIITSIAHMLDQLHLQATFSNVKTLRFAEELGIAFPYTRGYRGFSDNRLSLPATGEITPSTPLSCETDPLSDDCAADTAYFQAIVGWLVATSAGTWLTDYTVILEVQTQVVGDSSGRYQITIKDPDGVQVDLIQDVSFDQTVARYIGDVINPGTTYGGVNGNTFINWEERPAFLENDPTLPAYVVRQPSALTDKEFSGMANGIPTDPAFSSELDSAVIGSPGDSSGIFSVQSAETFDFNVLAIPGFTSGAVIGQGLQFCEGRGDVIYLVDPPFGLRPQQIVDWHNGMLVSDISAAINSSYGALYWGWLKTFDQYNDQNIWIPPSGHVAAVFARTARETEQWFAPAGLRRGRLLTALDVEYNPGQTERDLLYGSGNAVNPIVSFIQDGIVVFGQRTLQRATTALDRVNVRMLLIFLKKNLIRILRNFIFEPNDQTAWAQVRNVVNPFLSDIQARRGVDGYKVVCDETNNTPERRDQNQLWVSVFIKPTKAIEFVVLNLVILQSSASFNAEEVLAAGGVVFRGGSVVGS